MSEKKTGLELLREPFDKHQISKRPKPTKQQNEDVKIDFNKGIRCKECGGWHHPKVVHLDYVGHAALTDRLLNCDQNWNWEPMGLNNGIPILDSNGGLWIKLTVCGLTRLGYGHADGKIGGDAIKEAIGDALRNAAMRFGAALELWHKGDLHLNDIDNSSQDEQKRAAIEPKQPGPSQDKATPQEPNQKPVNHAPQTKGGISDAQAKRLFALAKRAGWKTEELKEELKQNWGVESTRDLKRDAYNLFCEYMEKGKTPVTIKGLPTIYP